MLLNLKGQLFDLSTPKVMGILNLTPDSFYDGGQYLGDEQFLFQTEKMLQEGATFIDVGAFSSRPNGEWITEEEEWQRLEQPLQALLQCFPEAMVSIDTFRSGVAARALDIGVAMVNDISAGHLDTNMMPLAAQR
ncbi:MAG: dihydropteroate synthase, partial [Flavobacterium sp.]